MTLEIISTRQYPLLTKHDRKVGQVTLHRLAPEWDGHALYLVQVDAAGIEYFAGPSNAARYADKTIGTLTGVRSGWAVTAYTDRNRFLAGREGWDGPLNAKSQLHGVRILLTYYHLLHYPNGERTTELLTAEACKHL